jgi:hypothetical protein
MTTPSQAADPAGEACPADDAAVIRLSRDEPEQFAAAVLLADKAAAAAAAQPSVPPGQWVYTKTVRLTLRRVPRSRPRASAPPPGA